MVNSPDCPDTYDGTGYEEDDDAEGFFWDMWEEGYFSDDYYG